MKRILVLTVMLLIVFTTGAQNLMQQRNKIIHSYGDMFDISYVDNVEFVTLKDPPYPCFQYFFAINNNTDQYHMFVMAKNITKTPIIIKKMEFTIDGTKKRWFTVNPNALQNSRKVGNVYYDYYQEQANKEMLKDLLSAKTCYVKFITTTGQSFGRFINTNNIRQIWVLVMNLVDYLK